MAKQGPYIGQTAPLRPLGPLSTESPKAARRAENQPRTRVFNIFKCLEKLTWSDESAERILTRALCTPEREVATCYACYLLLLLQELPATSRRVSSAPRRLCLRPGRCFSARCLAAA